MNEARQYSLFYELLETKFTVLEGRKGKRVLIPTKNLHEDRTMVKVGARILSFLTSPKTVNNLWDTYRNYQLEEKNIPSIDFDTFISGLDFLFIVKAIEYNEELIWRSVNVKKNI